VLLRRRAASVTLMSDRDKRGPSRSMARVRNAVFALGCLLRLASGDVGGEFD
jgi:hypothetical protein